ncbi:MAG: class I SAM-dependent methyltransferase [bacterium]|nr:class I SAM-dependent methyltransferase [bacterium]
MIISDEWQDYECISTSNGEKLERFNNIILVRPDPQIIWKIKKSNQWNKYDGYYHRSKEGGGYWEFKNKPTSHWIVNYKNLKFRVYPTNFKHVGLFPEQATNWDYIIKKINASNLQEINALNLFGYTGAATVALASTKATEVVHVDASKKINEWAKENIKLNNLSSKTVRYITEDAIKFIEREKRRKRKYQVVILDPPSYGRGPNKEVWKLENNLVNILEKIKEILADDYLFVLINCYTTGFSSISLSNLLKLTFQEASITAGEIGLPVTDGDLILPCGIYGRIENNIRR